MSVTECGVNIRDGGIRLSYVPERVSIAGMRLLSYKRPAYVRGWPLVDVWELGSGEWSHFPSRVRVPYCRPNLLVQTVWFMLNTSFPSGSLDF